MESGLKKTMKTSKIKPISKLGQEESQKINENVAKYTILHNFRIF